MKILSTAFKSGEMIPKKYTCEDKNVCPPFQILEPPLNVKSFALIVRDHDAPSGNFIHLLMWNINPQVREIIEGTTPVEAVLGINDFGNIGWGGPCPPAGVHRYEFHLYALNSMINLPSSSDVRALQKEFKGKILDEASITGLYGNINSLLDK